jgi:hypothetical protein
MHLVGIRSVEHDKEKIETGEDGVRKVEILVRRKARLVLFTHMRPASHMVEAVFPPALEHPDRISLLPHPFRTRLHAYEHLSVDGVGRRDD